MSLKKANLYFGLVLFIGFLVTGYYMKEYFKPEHLDNHVVRMQIRANHIYILFVSLLNVVSFKCELRMKSLDILFRTLILTAGVIAVIAFLKEHTGDLSVRSWTLLAVILSVASVGILLVNELLNRVSKKNRN